MLVFLMKLLISHQPLGLFLYGKSSHARPCAAGSKEAVAADGQAQGAGVQCMQVMGPMGQVSDMCACFLLRPKLPEE